jgi:hypothetical protein
MKSAFIFLFMPAVALLAAFAQEPVEKPAKPEAPAMTPEQEAFMKAGAIGPYHKLLEPFVGRWKAEVRIWSDPKAEPMVTSGTSSHTFIFGGRYLKMEFTGQYLGQSFIGLGFMGFDNVRKEFISFWIDNMSTWFLTSAGTVDREGKTFTMKGSFKDPMTGILRQQRDILKVEGPDRIVSQSFEASSDGKEFKTMEIVYMRAK